MAAPISGPGREHTVSPTSGAARAGAGGETARMRSSRRAHLVVAVEVGDEVRQREGEGPDAEQEDAGGDPARLVTAAADVADRDEAEHRRHVVAARHEARLLARQVEATFDRRYHDAHEPVHHHALHVCMHAISSTFLRYTCRRSLQTC